jgi:hypothetical protein
MPRRLPRSRRGTDLRPALEPHHIAAITELHGTMRDIHGLLKNQLDLRDRVERCEREIDDLK